MCFGIENQILQGWQWTGPWMNMLGGKTNHNLQQLTQTFAEIFTHQYVCQVSNFNWTEFYFWERYV